MGKLRYPVGIQSFSSIIEEDYVYVDKTHLIANLITEGKYIFLSRPRRFGKSLLLSTIHAFFDGRRDLFKGLAIDDMNMDWTPTPVLHFDFNSEDYSVEGGLQSLLKRQLAEFENIYGITAPADTIAGRFSQLIKKGSQGHRQKGRDPRG